MYPGRKNGGSFQELAEIQFGWRKQRDSEGA